MMFSTPLDTGMVYGAWCMVYDFMCMFPYPMSHLFRLGTAEVESALLKGSKDVSEAAVVGFPHDIKGMNIFMVSEIYGA